MTLDLTGGETRPWTRLHPLSPVLHFARALTLIAVVFLPRLANPLDVGSGLPWPELIGGAILVLAGLVSWLVTRWRVDRGELQIETGLIRRQSIRVPLRRVQAIDVVRPLLGRILGLAELRIVLAGSGRSHTRLAYLTEEHAHQVRAELLALAAGLAGDTPVPPERPILAVDTSTLLAATACSASAVAGAAVAIGVGVAAVVTARPVLVLALSWPVLLIAGGAAWRVLNTEYGFVVAEAPDGLRLRSGLLQTRAETVPRGRVQAVRWISPVLWRPFGWQRLEIDVARQRQGHGGDADSGALTRALLPVGTREDAEALLVRVLPAATISPPPDARPPRRARLRAPLSYHNLAVWYDERYVWTRTGRLRPTVTVVPLEKVQSLRRIQGPVQRRLRLATLHVDTAGRRWHAVAYARDDSEATALLHRLTDLSRAARRSPRAPVGAGAAGIRPSHPENPVAPRRAAS